MDQFFYTTSCAVRNDALRNELVDLQNIRKRLQLVVLESEDLVKFGPMKEDLVEDELVNRILSYNHFEGGEGRGGRREEEGRGGKRREEGGGRREEGGGRRKEEGGGGRGGIGYSVIA